MRLIILAVALARSSAFSDPSNSTFEVVWVHTPHKDSNAALFLAAYKCDLASVKTLLAIGADAQSHDEDSMTPLHYSSCGPVTAALIAANAEVDAVSKQARMTPLYLAVLRDRIDNVRELLRAQADASIVDESGIGPVLVSILRDKVPILQELLAAPSVDVNAVGEDGLTYLHVATVRRRIEIVKLLLAAGADVYAVDSRGEAALAYARDEDILRAILERRK
jgi:ankyrin repeat protein